MKELQDSHIRLNGTDGELAAEVFAEGFRGDADNARDFVLRDAAQGEETDQLSMAFSAAKGVAAGAFR